nr:MAG TPA: hypothetical protein [Bacteriophage sp.]
MLIFLIHSKYYQFLSFDILLLKKLLTILSNDSIIPPLTP